ncbi:MAG TPA: ABC-type transport auxiliary lipoprotein family protein [Azonexus sp.]|nr:ABC-type transport auxiliary lipoprotein family protein [Azonexus sp.]
MNSKNKIAVGQFSRRLLGVLTLMTLAGCSALQPAATPNPTVYSLERIPGGAAVAAPTVAPVSAPTLIVSPPRAAAGYENHQIIYVREPHKLEHFAHNQWIEPPARMLAPLIVAAIENSGTFRAVVRTPSTAAGDLRLDTEIIRLQQEFRSQPSLVRFTLRAHLIDENTRHVVAWREFDTSVAATSDDPYGGVVAANLAVQAVLEKLSAFCAEAARGNSK